MRQIVSRELLDIPPVAVAVQHGAGVADLAALYERYLEGHGLLGHGFVFRELARLRGLLGGLRSESTSHMLPPPSCWHRMVPTLALAQVLRDRMVAEGAHGLRIAAAYRPAGGEDRSLHKVNAALDLDLVRRLVDGLVGDDHAATGEIAPPDPSSVIALPRDGADQERDRGFAEILA